MRRTWKRSKARYQPWTVLACALWSVVACGPAYRSPTLFKGRVISQQKLGANDYAVYSAALPEFLPDDDSQDWIAVAGVTIPAEPVDPLQFNEAHRSTVEELAGKLLVSSDTVYVIDQRFAEPPSVAVSPLMDTINWVPVQWHRTIDKTYPAGLVSFSRTAIDPAGEWALVYGLYGKGPMGSGFPRAVLLRKQSGSWSVVDSQRLGE